MAIEVISESPPDDLWRKVTCPHCGTSYRYMPTDIRSSVHHDYGGGSDTWWWIPCTNLACSKEYIEVKAP